MYIIMRIMSHKFILIILSVSLIYLSFVFGDFTENSVNYNQSVLQETIELEYEGFMFHVPGDKWTTEAIKDIVYYLRNHKFNNWDIRYREEKSKESTGFVGAFPVPQLRSLHWEVKANCHNDFYKCIRYLFSIIKNAPYSRTEDSITSVSTNINAQTIKKLYLECKERHTYANKIGLPLDDPSEKFQWSVTASYYMCWFTMLGTPALSMIGESCDNFANCGDTYFFKHNHDPRADDNLSFKCAIYSFCPDPCCPTKYIKSYDDCYNNNKINPCFLENSRVGAKKICEMDRKLNENFEDIISNRWNISCSCKEGFKWESMYGMCVDINECLLGIHNCDRISQDCLNLPESFHCVCKWEYDSNSNATFCVKRHITVFDADSV